MANLKSEILHLSGDIKVLKEDNIKFKSKITEQDKNIFYLTTSFLQKIEKIIVNDKVDSKIAGEIVN